MWVIEIFSVVFLPVIVYVLVFTNGFVSLKLRKCFDELTLGFVSVHLYVVIVYLWMLLRQDTDEPWPDWIMAAAVLFMAGMNLEVFFRGLKYSYMERFQKNMGVRFWAHVINLLLILLSTVATLNYASYMLWPFLYAIPEGLSDPQIAFEFVYYTFMLVLTYNGGTIVPVHTASKIMQMVELVVFFACFGIILTDLFNKLKGAAEAKINQDNALEE